MPHDRLQLSRMYAGFFSHSPSSAHVLQFSRLPSTQVEEKAEVMDAVRLNRLLNSRPKALAPPTDASNSNSTAGDIDPPKSAWEGTGNLADRDSTVIAVHT